MKKLALISVLCASGLFGATSALAAGPTSSGFTVDVNLTTKCVATTSGTPSLAFDYTGFQTGASTPTAPVSITFKCTRGIAAPTLSFDTTSGTSTSGSALGATGEGVAAGLRYTLSVGGNTSTDAGTAASNSDGGSGKLLAYSVTGTIAAGQAGEFSTVAGFNQQVRSLIVTY